VVANAAQIHDGEFVFQGVAKGIHIIQSGLRIFRQDANANRELHWPVACGSTFQGRKKQPINAVNWMLLAWRNRSSASENVVLP
jgi:hypothetical protein